MLLIFSLLLGVGKSHHSGSVWESFSDKTGKLSNICRVSAAFPQSSGWNCSGMLQNLNPSTQLRY